MFKTDEEIQARIDRIVEFLKSEFGDTPKWGGVEVHYQEPTGKDDREKIRAKTVELFFGEIYDKETGLRLRVDSTWRDGKGQVVDPLLDED